MSVTGKLFTILCTYADKNKVKNWELPADVLRYEDIAYGNKGIYHLLDIYQPTAQIQPLPIIINIHGGGYVYGTKEVYKHYGCFMAKQGFTFINPNYHLAPTDKFPTQLEDINQIVEWVLANKQKYQFDTSSIFFVGDSVGAQLLSHYCAIYANANFASLFRFKIPKELTIKAIALNCGIYDISTSGHALFNHSKIKLKGILDLLYDYLGKDFDFSDPKLRMLEAINQDFPPTIIMTSHYDVFKDVAIPMYELLQAKSIPSKYQYFGTNGQFHIGHVFHLTINLEEAKECNQQQTDFFKSFLPSNI